MNVKMNIASESVLCCITLHLVEDSVILVKRLFAVIRLIRHVICISLNFL